ncbi:MAG: hypothetical protein AAF213_13615 [Pseudomonadota bacterium]
MSILAFDLSGGANPSVAALNRHYSRPRSDQAVPPPPSFLSNLGLSKTDRQAIWVSLAPEARVASLLAGRAVEGRGGYQPVLYPPTTAPLNDRTAFAVTAYMNLAGLQGYDGATTASNAGGYGDADYSSGGQAYSWQPVIPLDIDLVPPSRGLNLAGHVAAAYNEKMAKDGGLNQVA